MADEAEETPAAPGASTTIATPMDTASERGEKDADGDNPTHQVASKPTESPGTVMADNSGQNQIPVEPATSTEVKCSVLKPYEFKVDC